jgi:hypothetical protein
VRFGLGTATGPAVVRVRWPDGSSSETKLDARATRAVVLKP